MNTVQLGVRIPSNLSDRGKRTLAAVLDYAAERIFLQKVSDGSHLHPSAADGTLCPNGS